MAGCAWRRGRVWADLGEETLFTVADFLDEDGDEDWWVEDDEDDE